eukprot:gene14744-biopygen1069
MRPRVSPPGGRYVHCPGTSPAHVPLLNAPWMHDGAMLSIFGALVQYWKCSSTPNKVAFSTKRVGGTVGGNCATGGTARPICRHGGTAWRHKS